MGELRAIRHHVFTDLDVDRSDVSVRFRFLEDIGEAGTSEAGVTGWSEPSLVIRFIIYKDCDDVRHLDVGFPREQWPDVQDIPDDALQGRLEIAQPALEALLETL